MEPVVLLWILIAIGYIALFISIVDFKIKTKKKEKEQVYLALYKEYADRKLDKRGNDLDS